MHRKLTVTLARGWMLSALLSLAVFSSACEPETEPFEPTDSSLEVSVKVEGSFGMTRGPISGIDFEVFTTFDYEDGTHSYWTGKGTSDKTGIWSYKTDPQANSMDEQAFLGSDPEQELGTFSCYEACLDRGSVDYTQEASTVRPGTCEAYKAKCTGGKAGQTICNNPRHAGEVKAVRTYVGFYIHNPDGCTGEYRLLEATETASEKVGNDLIKKSYTVCYNCMKPTSSTLDVVIDVKDSNGDPYVAPSPSGYSFAAKAYVQFKDGTHAYWGTGFEANDLVGGTWSYQGRPDYAHDNEAFQGTFEQTNCFTACTTPGQNLSTPVEGGFPDSCALLLDSCGVKKSWTGLQYRDRAQEAEDIQSIRMFVEYRGQDGKKYEREIQTVSSALVGTGTWKYHGKLVVQ